MPRVCTICTHDRRVEVDNALVARERFRTIADRFAVSKTALLRHHDDHLPTSLVRARHAREAAQADELLAQVVELRDHALRVLGEADGDRNWPATIAAIREARGCIELLAKLAGQLAAQPTINVIMTPEWLEVQAGILAALRPYPDARLAVATSLETHHAPDDA